MVDFFVNFGQRMELSIIAKSLVIHRLLIKTNRSYQNSFQNCAINFNSYVIYRQASNKRRSACLILDLFHQVLTSWTQERNWTFIRRS